MTNQFYSTGTLKIYDPMNSSERALLHSISQEDIERQSPIIRWFKFAESETILTMDQVDRLYGEAVEHKFEIEPIEVFAIVEKSPILQELQRMGFTQTEEVNFVVNIPDFIGRVGREPIAGDLFRISYFGQEGERNIHVFYKVSTVSPNDVMLGQYTNFLVNAEQTSMENVPKWMLEYLDGDGEAIIFSPREQEISGNTVKKDTLPANLRDLLNAKQDKSEHLDKIASLTPSEGDILIGNEENKWKLDNIADQEIDGEEF